ncbi:MAG: FGGY-family carbohydrate kinase [Bacilli bacterium]|nr:FGGY-family carbohydrate kinase [Bacilli bacterium]
MEPLVMTFDFGTQSVRASIYDAQGNCLIAEKEPYRPAYFATKPWYAEQDPEYYFQCLCSCTKRISEKKPELIDQVEAITMTCFRDSAVLLDKDNKVLRPMILWLDQRMAKCEEKLPFISRLAFALVGKTGTIEINRRRTMANWVRENEPEIWDKCAKYVAISTYFIYRLTGELVDCPSDFTGHYPLDYKKREWYKEPTKHLQGQVFGVRKDQLCKLVPGEALLGEISEEAAKLTGLKAGMKMYAAGSDKSCETLGTGVTDETYCSISLGTACTVETTSKKFISPAPFLPAYPNVLPDRYNVDIQIYRGFWMINWFLSQFAGVDIEDVALADINPQEYNEKLHEVPPGSSGLIVQPFWGSNLDKPETKGLIIGFSDSVTKEHVYRAIIEGITYELREAKERFEKSIGHKFEAVRIAGGGARSPEICQIIANILGTRVEKVQTIETSSLGAAMSGFLSIKKYASPEEAVKAMVRKGDSYEPDPKEQAVYDELYENVYKKLYPKLKDTYKYLYDFSLRTGEND